MLLICLSIAGCSAKIASDGTGFRPASAPIYSIAAFDVARLAGNWDQVAAFAGPAQAGCAAGEAAFVPKDGALHLTYKLCLSGEVVSGAGTIVTTGPGRFSVMGKDGIGQDWWVLWVDEGYRTMAIGNPGGAFGFILNKGNLLPSDRLAAAREVLDFNSYNVSMLAVFRSQ